jgi:hypothetical protein
VLELSPDFFETLLAHAVPLDPTALGALKHSSLALDTYSWLAHRLCRVQRAQGVKITWTALRDQFGQEFADINNFRRKMQEGRRVIPKTVDNPCGNGHLSTVIWHCFCSVFWHSFSPRMFGDLVLHILISL